MPRWLTGVSPLDISSNAPSFIGAEEARESRATDGVLETFLAFGYGFEVATFMKPAMTLCFLLISWQLFVGMAMAGGHVRAAVE